jgi:hypothetical protein
LDSCAPALRGVRLVRAWGAKRGPGRQGFGSSDRATSGGLRWWHSALFRPPDCGVPAMRKGAAPRARARRRNRASAGATFYRLRGSQS